MKISEPELRKTLIALGDAVVEQAQSRVEDRSLRIDDERFVLRANFSLYYSLDPSQVTFPMEERIEKACEREGIERLVVNSIRTHQEFQVIAGLFPDDSSQGGVLDGFVRAIALDVALKPNTDLAQQIARHIDVLIRDLKRGKLDYKIKIWLRGITLADDPIQVSEHLTFRRPNRVDFQERIPARIINYAHAMHLGRTTFSCIVDTRIQTEFPMGAQRLVDKLVTALRLYRVGAVAASRLDMAAESFSMFAQFSVAARSR